MLKALQDDLQLQASPTKATLLQKYFKTGAGEYGEGDIFIGLTVPQSKMIAKKYKTLELKDIEVLLTSKVHEERFIALVILKEQFKKADEVVKKSLFNFYLAHTKYINNWDLVD